MKSIKVSDEMHARLKKTGARNMDEAIERLGEKVVTFPPGDPSKELIEAFRTFRDTEKEVQVHLNELRGILSEILQSRDNGGSKGHSSEVTDTRVATIPDDLPPIQTYESVIQYKTRVEVVAAGLDPDLLVKKRDNRLIFTRCKICEMDNMFDGKCACGESE